MSEEEVVPGQDVRTRENTVDLAQQNISYISYMYIYV